jgi:ferredoxin
MVYVDDTVCNGCGVCVDLCPTGALIFQNNHAYIDQDLCQECEACPDACPQGAILLSEMLPAPSAVVHSPNPPPPVLPKEKAGLRVQILPVIGSFLMWTGRELGPRLADAALGYLDQRIQSSQSSMTQERKLGDSSQTLSIGVRKRRERRRRRRGKNRRVVKRINAIANGAGLSITK